MWWLWAAIVSGIAGVVISPKSIRIAFEERGLGAAIATWIGMSVIPAIVFFALFYFITPASAQTYEGYSCIYDCSGHRAGYEWAQRKGVSTYSDCYGNSTSFSEGCQAYVDNPYRYETEVDDDGNYVPD